MGADGVLVEAAPVQVGVVAQALGEGGREGGREGGKEGWVCKWREGGREGGRTCP